MMTVTRSVELEKGESYWDWLPEELQKEVMRLTLTQGLCGMPSWNGGGAPVRRAHRTPEEVARLVHAKRDRRENCTCVSCCIWEPPLIVCEEEIAVPPPEYWSSISEEVERLTGDLIGGDDHWDTDVPFEARGEWDSPLLAPLTEQERVSAGLQRKSETRLEPWGHALYRLQGEDVAHEFYAHVSGFGMTHVERKNAAVHGELLRLWGAHGPWNKEPFDADGWEQRLRAEALYERMCEEDPTVDLSRGGGYGGMPFRQLLERHGPAWARWITEVGQVYGRGGVHGKGKYQGYDTYEFPGLDEEDYGDLFQTKEDAEGQYQREDWVAYWIENCPDSAFEDEWGDLC